MRHLVVRQASLNAGFSETVSDRALINKGPSETVLYHLGINPQRIDLRRLPFSLDVTVCIFVVGQTL